MAKTRDYMDYLDESIGIAPAHSQEEYQASEVISQIMTEHGLETAVEEFDSAGTGVMARNVLAIVLFVTLLVAGLVPDTLHIVMLLVALASAGLLTFMRFVRNIFENIGPARRSQNVVAVRRARSQDSGHTSRPIVIVAHYDTPREEPMRRGGLARYQSMLVRVGVFCPAVVCVTVLFQLLGFLPEGFRMFMWVVGLIACLPAVVLAVTSLMGRFGNCTVGANNNKSSIAAMLTLVDKIAPAEDRATDAARSRPRPRREVRLQETPEVEPTRKSEQVTEEVKGVRHGEEVLRSLGILPVSCEITYEQPRVVAEDEQIEVALNPYDEASDVAELEADEQYDDYEDYDDYDEDSYDSDYEDESDEEYDDDYDEDYADEYDDEYEDEYEDVESDDEDVSDQDEAPKPERRVVRLSDDESDDEELSDDYDEFDEYDEEYDDEYDEEDEEFEDDQDGTPIGSSIGAWFSERIDKLRSRFGSKDEGESDDWIDEDDEYEEEDVEEESFEDEEDDYDSEDIDEQDEEEYVDEYDDELEDDYDEDEDYSEDEEEPSDEEDDSEDEFDYDDPGADVDEDEEYDDDQEPEDEEGAWEEYDEQEEDPDAVADIAHDAEAEEDFESDFEYGDDDDDLYPSSSFEPIEFSDDEEFEEEDEIDPNPPKRRPLFGRLLRRKADPEPEEVDYEEEEEDFDDQSDETEIYEEDAHDFEDGVDSDDIDVEYLDGDDVEDESDDYSDEEYYDDGLYEDEYDEEEYYEEESEEELEENEPAKKGPSLGQRILGLFRGKRNEDSHEEEPDEDSDEYYLEEEEYDEEYDGEYYDDDEFEEGGVDESDQDSSIEEDSPVADYADDYEEYDEYDEYDDQASTQDDVLMDDEYVDEEEAVELPAPTVAPAPVRPPDPNMLHFDREEDDDIPERDDSGINTITDNYDLLDGDIPRESQRARPAAIDDPTWGTSTYQPTRPSYNIARRAALYDLPDPSGATVDPLADEYEYTEDVPATREEAQRTGGRVGFWGDDDSAQASSWKGGATLRDDLRDDPYESAEGDLKDAMLDMGDEFLDEHDVWFVATGASEAEHGGMKAFLDAHRRDIRGAFLINLECVGAGTLSVYVREGLATHRRADRRLVRLIGDVARDLHIKVDTAMCDWTETDAATAMKARVRSATIVGLDDSDLPALSHTVDDVPENVSPKQVYDVVRIITEVIRRS